jgi:hypothetical protein
MRGRLKVAASRRGYHALVNIVRGTRPLGIVSSSAPQVRRARAGVRKRLMGSLLATDPERLVEPSTRGDPQSPLRWTCKRVRQLAQALCRQGHARSHQPIGVATGSWLTRGRVFHSVRKSQYGNAAHESRNRAVGVSRPTAHCLGWRPMRSSWIRARGSQRRFRRAIRQANCGSVLRCAPPRNDGATPQTPDLLRRTS